MMKNSGPCLLTLGVSPSFIHFSMSIESAHIWFRDIAAVRQKLSTVSQEQAEEEELLLAFNSIFGRLVWDFLTFQTKKAGSGFSPFVTRSNRNPGCQITTTVCKILYVWSYWQVVSNITKCVLSLYNPTEKIKKLYQYKSVIRVSSYIQQASLSG